MIKKYNLSKAEKYNKGGEERTYWANVGTMTEFIKEDGSVSRIVEIPAIGLKASVFEQRAREEKPQWERYAQENKKVKSEDASLEESFVAETDDVNPF